ncbi:MAG: catalase family protein [Caulobacteraceae bacterium]|nr:catalase family protein [Caulobacter sp.]
MLTHTHKPALRYDPSVEEVADDEAETSRGLVETMAGISATTLKDTGCPLRSVHAKSHALVEGELEVAGDLDPVLAQGLFARPGRYPVVLRFSTIPGDMLADSVSTPRGVAIKVIGVDGPRLPGSDGDATQDFILVNGPAFGAPTPKAFLANLKLLAATTDKAEGAKKALSGVTQALNGAVTAVTGKPSAMLATFGGQPETHILGDTFYSQTPFRFGDYVAKFSLAPVSDELKALKDKHIKINGVPDALRDACNAFFSDTGGLWDLQVQLRRDEKTMPVEDASKAWDEAESPYQTVARLRVAPQPAWTKARSQAVDDGLSFSVWHGLAAFQPLGGVNRTRKPAYEAGKTFRNEHGDHITEPREEVRLPG